MSSPPCFGNPLVASGPVKSSFNSDLSHFDGGLAAPKPQFSEGADKACNIVGRLVELDGKAANIARKIRRTLAARHRREPHEGRCPLAGALEQVGAGIFRERLVVFKESIGPLPPPHHPPPPHSPLLHMEKFLS